jgi:type II secretory pathway pseudopilin PulG
MIVITMIIILMSITLFPYSYYMDRARVEKNIDMIAQEWVLAHNDIRNGLLYSGSIYAHLSLKFQKGSDTINILMSTGETASERPYRTITLDSGIEIIEIDGGSVGTGDLFIYRISPPSSRGEYSTG